MKNDEAPDSPSKTPPNYAVAPPPAAEVVAAGTRTEIPAKPKPSVPGQTVTVQVPTPKKRKGGWFFFNANESED